MSNATFIALFFALLASSFNLVSVIALQTRIVQIETTQHEVCVSMKHLFSNRPRPPIHSYAKDLPICGHPR